MLGAFGFLVAVLCLAIWTAVAFGVSSHVRTERPLHLTTVYLTLAWTLGFDVVLVLGTLAAAGRLAVPGPIVMGLFGFIMGVQLVAALSAFLFLRRL